MTQHELAKMGSECLGQYPYAGWHSLHQESYASPVERHFYQRAAPHLHGVNTPALLRVEGDTLIVKN